MMKLIGIDYGKKRVGVAYSEGIYAQPLTTLSTSAAIAQLLQICNVKQIEKVIVGIPVGLFAERVVKFGEKLKTHLACPVIFQDETLSSQKAKYLLISQGEKLKKRKHKEHESAAALILQTFIDNNL